MSSSRDEEPHISVLLSVAPPDGTTRFVDQVTRHAPPNIHFQFFSWRIALFGRWDVFHVHWPEFLIRGRTTAVEAIRTILFMLFLLRLLSTRKKVVRTLHNITPHKAGSGLESFLLRLLDKRTNVFVRLNNETPIPSDAPSVHIPHGHYRDVLNSAARRPPIGGRLLYFGRIESYKNVERLVRVFGHLSQADLELRVVGKGSAELQERIVNASSGDDRVSIRFGFVPDDDMVAEMTAAQLIVLPYTEMHNSGIVLVALSLDRPVLVPKTPANALLADEVGKHWIRLFDGELNEADLLEALEATTALPASGPELSGRDWDTVATSYAKAYRFALGPGTPRSPTSGKSK
ncbi:beta-1,4-mannosyltransferase [Rathayibacter sp. PhB127]|nr:beta-1,4-mannosyltransferase [Rathayibacter sp. PhB127]